MYRKIDLLEDSTETKMDLLTKTQNAVNDKMSFENEQIKLELGKKNSILEELQISHVFSHVCINVEGGYDNSTGNFTTPISGTYFFHSAVVYCN